MMDAQQEPPREPRVGWRGRFRRAGAATKRAMPFVAGIAATFIALGLFSWLAPPPAPLTRQDIQQGVVQALGSQKPGPPATQLAYQAIQPSLVRIEATGPPPVKAGGATPQRLGAGVIVDASGNVLTALHVVADATSIKLTFADGTTSAAQVATRSPENDIAVLQPSTLPATVVPATLGNPGAMRVGSDAFVVGNPFGLEDSMSAGVVSGLNRSFQAPGSNQVLRGLIQVDAAVNPGNSGGPLLDRSGAVVGIVNALVNPSKEDVFIGIGLAVPIDVAGGAAGLPPY